MTTHAAAPSDNCDALPAVTVACGSSSPGPVATLQRFQGRRGPVALVLAYRIFDIFTGTFSLSLTVIIVSIGTYFMVIITGRLRHARSVSDILKHRRSQSSLDIVPLREDIRRLDHGHPER